jgi:hypothetical protein
MKKALSTLFLVSVTSYGFPALAQDTIIINGENAGSSSPAEELATCIEALNSLQNEDEEDEVITLTGRERLPSLPRHRYLFTQPSNVSDEAMQSAGLRNRDGDEIWAGPNPRITVRTTSEGSGLSNTQIMDICLERTMPAPQ